MPLKVTPADASLAGAHLPFEEQIAFFQGKLGKLIPTRTWRDVRHAAHDTGFMVAGATKADLLSDFVMAVDGAISEGKSLQWFRQAFDAIVEEHGWGHTGGRDWRSKVIYQTNMATSYAAGRLAQLRDPELQKLAPYWMYVHNDSVLHPRPLHLSWNRLVLPADDPWFKTHYPPNGWGCRCRVTAVSRAQATRDGGRFGPVPDDGINKKTGTPNGIDRGWDYMPGDTVTGQIRQTLLDKAAKLPPRIGAALARDLNDLPAFLPAADYVGTVGTDFRQAMESGLVTIPGKVRQAVADAGWSVTGGPTLIDIAPRLANETPVGALPGVTWAHIDGIAMPKERTIGIGETALLLSGRRVQTSAARVGALLRHEHAHVLDDLAISVSRQPEFMAAYTADAAVLREWRGRLGKNDDAGRDLEKLLGEGAPREAFADLFAELYGGGTAASLTVARAMPRTHEVVKRLMEEWLK